MGDNLIEPSGVAIARGDVTLGGGVVAISPPGSDESSEVAVVLVEWHAVITVPAIEHCFLHVVWHRACLVERALGVMCFACCVKVQRLKVHSAARFTILLGAYHHTVAPCHRLSDWYGFKDS